MMGGTRIYKKKGMAEEGGKRGLNTKEERLDTGETYEGH